MFYYFTRGKTHDLYALIVIFVLAVVLYFTSASPVAKFISIADMILSAGVFVDLWSHCFHH